MVFSIEPVGQVANLARLWRELEARADTTFYLTWDWIGHWLAEIDADCYAVIGRFEGKIVALAILARTNYRRHGLKLNALLLHETGKPDIDVVTIEYNGILADRAVHEMATVACLNFLQRPEVTAALGERWDEIRFGGVAQSFERYLQATGLRVWQVSQKPSWAVALDAIRQSGQPYLDHLSANTRYQIRRALRLYEQRGPVTATAAHDVEEAMRFYAEMQELHQRYWVARGEPGSYAFPFYKRFHERILADCIPRGTVEIVRVTAGTSVIGYVYNFISGGSVCAYHTGLSYDPDPKFKPGLVSHYLCIERHLQAGARCYDFLAGDNRYKANLGTRGPNMMHLVLQRQSLGIRVEHALRGVKTRTLSRWIAQPRRPAESGSIDGSGTDKRKVLVLGDDTRSFLTIVRSLGRQGIEVHVAPINLRSTALRSRYIHKVHRLPSYTGGGGRWVDEVSRLLSRERYDLVISCDDRTLLPLSANRNTFAKSAMLAIPTLPPLQRFSTRKGPSRSPLLSASISPAPSCPKTARIRTRSFATSARRSWSSQSIPTGSTRCPDGGSCKSSIHRGSWCASRRSFHRTNFTTNATSRDLGSACPYSPARARSCSRFSTIACMKANVAGQAPTV